MDRRFPGKMGINPANTAFLTVMNSVLLAVLKQRDLDFRARVRVCCGVENGVLNNRQGGTFRPDCDKGKSGFCGEGF